MKQLNALQLSLYFRKILLFFIKTCVFLFIISCVIVWLFVTSDNRIIRIRKWEHAKGPHLYALDFIGLVEQHGKKAEEYTVITEDGYILSLFRIPPNSNSNHENNKNRRNPVFIQHALFCSSDAWVLRNPESNLPIVLSDAGYDVWVSNVRGNSYGRRHLKLSPDNYRFWNYSLDDHALKDLPANLDFVLRSTNSSSVTLIGMSMGTVITKILLSQKPEYNSKINLFINLASVAYLKTSNSMTRLMMHFYETIFHRIPHDRPMEFLPSNELNYLFINYFCFLNDYFKQGCIQLLDAIVGDDPEQSLWPNETLTAALTIPAGTSTKIMHHCLQVLRSGDFKFYDYEDTEENLKHYGRPTPPHYDVANINVPMVIFHGKNDPFSTMENDHCLLKQLPKDRIVIHEIVNWTKFNHIDFITARDVRKLVYNRVLEVIDEFGRKTGQKETAG